jgi:hypothetical protein
LNKDLTGKKGVLIEYLAAAIKGAPKPQETGKPSSSDETP